MMSYHCVHLRLASDKKKIENNQNNVIVIFNLTVLIQFNYCLVKHVTLSDYIHF